MASSLKLINEQKMTNKKLTVTFIEWSKLNIKNNSIAAVIKKRTKYTCFSFFLSSSKSFFISFTISCLIWAWDHKQLENIITVCPCHRPMICVILDVRKIMNGEEQCFSREIRENIVFCSLYLFDLCLHNLGSHLGRCDRRCSFHHHLVPDIEFSVSVLEV